MEVTELKTFYHPKQDEETSLSETNATQTKQSIFTGD